MPDCRVWESLFYWCAWMCNSSQQKGYTYTDAELILNTLTMIVCLRPKHQMY